MLSNYLIPVPAKIQQKKQTFQLTGIPTVRYLNRTSVRLHEATDRFMQRLQALLPNLRGTTTSAIVINCKASTLPYPFLGMDESYKLDVLSNSIQIQANSEWGIMYGFESLLQLIQTNHEIGFSIPVMSIADRPAYPWRGLLLDIARHWLGPDCIYATLDGMASLKLNVLHLHLSDDQAFRLEIPSLPALTQTGSDGRFLSAQQAKKIVAYASQRGIRIVPEIDMPGHVTAWLAAYPELAVVADSYSPSKQFGPHSACINPYLQITYDIITKIFADIVAIFPDSFIHIGGDEVEAYNQHIAGDLKVPAETAHANHSMAQSPQAFFSCRIVEILTKFERQVIGWDEILQSDLPKNTVIQCWRNSTMRDAILEAGHPMIFSQGYYLDLNLPAISHYRFNPAAKSADLQIAEQAMIEDIGDEISKKSIHNFLASIAVPEISPQSLPGMILGGEACLWSELVTENSLDTRLFSRLPAIAERLWNGNKTLEEEDLYARLQAFLSYLERTTSLRPLQSISTQMQSMGVAQSHLQAAQTFLSGVEPVRWHRRLLGAELLKARAEQTDSDHERPYDTTTALDRFVDICPPESFVARSCLDDAKQYLDGSESAVIRKKLRLQAQQWQDQFLLLSTMQPLPPQVEEILTISALLAKAANFMEKFLAADTSPSKALVKQWQQWQQEENKIVAELQVAIIPAVQKLARINA